MGRIVSACLFALALVACQDSPVEPFRRAPAAPFSPPADAPVGPTATSVARLSLTEHPSSLNVVGIDRWMTLLAYDPEGQQIDPAAALVTSSNPGVATVSEVGSYDHFACDTSVGSCWKVWEGRVALRTVGAGTATITASLRGATDSLSIQVRPFPTAPAHLVIDSFRVVEYAPTCAWSCPYRAYVPLIWLRQPGGAPTELLQAMRVGVQSVSTGWCFSSGALAAGDTRTVNATFDPYLWNNDFFAFSREGPVPDGPATLQVIVADEDGRLRIAEATAAIERNGTPPLGGPGGC